MKFESKYEIGKEFFELQELLNTEEFDEDTGELIARIFHL